jgi:hypothetical protein
MLARCFESRCDPAFAEMLDANYLNRLETHPYTAYGVWTDHTLAYMNPAWFGFAESNGGKTLFGDWTIGRSTLDVIPPAINKWYLQFVAAARSSPGAHPEQHEYECSSAEVYRRFLMTIYPVSAGTEKGYVIVHSLKVETSHTEVKGPAKPTVMEEYADGAGLIRQCMHCRLIRSAKDPSRWDWVAEWVRQPQSNVSHSLCDVCFEHYYRSPFGDAQK